MSRRKHNIVRSILRSFEVLLFFVISVVGFSALAKTTSFNSKTKVKSLSGYPAAASSDRTLPAAPLFLTDALDCFNGFFSSPQKKSSSSYTNASGFSAYSDVPHHLHDDLTHCSICLKQCDFPALSPLLAPGNLFQQNPVLLI